MRTLIWKRNSKVHDMKTKRRPIWMKIGPFWPLNLRRWINFLKVCVNYSISWYTYVDILFTHHPYPESWESIPCIYLLHGNYTHKNVQHTVLVWTFCYKNFIHWVFMSYFSLRQHADVSLWCHLWNFGLIQEEQFSFDTNIFFLWVRFHIA